MSRTHSLDQGNEVRINIPLNVDMADTTFGDDNESSEHHPENGLPRGIQNSLLLRLVTLLTLALNLLIDSVFVVVCVVILILHYNDICDTPLPMIIVGLTVDQGIDLLKHMTRAAAGSERIAAHLNNYSVPSIPGWVLSGLALLDKVRGVFSLTWFFLGNLFFYSSKSCNITNPGIYHITEAYLITRYVLMALPLFCCLLICVSSPFLVLLVTWIANHAPDSLLVSSGGTRTEVLQSLATSKYTTTVHIISDETVASDVISMPSTVDETCSVCICVYQDGDTVKHLPCKHFFHDACITPWVKLHATCPLCRYDLNGLTHGTLPSVQSNMLPPSEDELEMV